VLNLNNQNLRVITITPLHSSSKRPKQPGREGGWEGGREGGREEEDINAMSSACIIQ
jgi:hypothetical protein